jgi:asparagine synthase (glutamine-hydrolysing)
LSGFGGDEFLGQALEARVAMADAAAQLKLSTFARELIAWSLFWRQPIYPTLLKTLELLFPPVLRMQVIGAISSPAEWLDPDFASRYGLVTARLTASEGPWWWLPSARDWYQTRARIAGILTNLHSNLEEMRYPYLDQRLTEFLASIPVEQLLRPGDRRSLMRRALRGLVPSEVLLRRSKQQESRGYVLTLRKHWQQVQELLRSPLIAELGYVRATEFRKALSSLRDGCLYRESMMLLRGLFLEVWLRSCMEHNIFWTQGQCPDDIHGSGIEVSFSASRST